MLHRAASNAYSWWWASHIRTNQSKWLDTNLQEMEERVKSMLKIIEEDADSFSKRAEMYYKRRPELINFVEDSYRVYRALAERYDRISGELHKANNTIATAFPDKVPLEIQDDDEDSSLKAFSPIDSSKVPKPPAAIPQVIFRSKTKKIRSDIQMPQNSKVNSIEKSKAEEAIDKLQKRILVLQTEKEFIKSSYDTKLAKYREIEKEVTKMQEEVCLLQDEFSTSSVIEDDEARALMAATALNSCSDTLVKLLEKQKRLAEFAKIESIRIMGAKEKVKALKGDPNESELVNRESYEDSKEENISCSDMGDDIHGLHPERHELESLCEKVREHFQMGSHLSVAELPEKIDDLVNKVISMEMILSSQNVQLDRLRSEADNLQKELQSLEDEKLNMIGHPDTLINKLRHAEEELQKIQDIEKSVQDQKNVIHTCFLDAYHSLSDISVTIWSSKHDEVVDRLSAFHNEEVEPFASPKSHNVKDSVEIGKNIVNGNASSIQEHGFGPTEPFSHVHFAVSFPQVNNSETSSDLEMPIRADSKKINDKIKDDPHIIPACVSRDPPDLETEVTNDPDICRKHQGEIAKFNNILGNQEEMAKISDDMDNFIEEANVTHVFYKDVNAEEDTSHAAPEHQLEGASEQPKDFGKEVTEIQGTCNAADEADHIIHEHGVPLKCVESIGKPQFEDEPELDNAEDPDRGIQLGKRDSISEFDNNIHQKNKSIQESDQVDTLNLQGLLLNGLEGREKVLLNEYTSILRHYKEAKKKLSDAESKNEEFRCGALTQIEDLKNTNSMKDEEIQLLKKRLVSFRKGPNERLSAIMEVEDTSHENLGSKFSFPRLIAVSSSSRRLFSSSLKGVNSGSNENSFDAGDMESTGDMESALAEDGIKLIHIGDPSPLLGLEEKFRRDIDALLEENLDFWLRFSTTFHEIQKFQMTFENLRTDMENMKAQEGSSSGGSDHSVKIETALDNQLRDLKTELQVWIEQNAMLKEELQKRFASLRDIQEDIFNALSDPEAEETQLTQYQAGKFQGEVLNMQQENTKVDNELQAGLDHVKALRTEVEKALYKIHDDGFQLHGSRGSGGHHFHFRNFSTKTRIPLRSFLFGNKPKKAPTTLSLVNLATLKGSGDLRTSGPLR